MTIFIIKIVRFKAYNVIKNKDFVLFYLIRTNTKSTPKSAHMCGFFLKIRTCAAGSTGRNSQKDYLYIQNSLFGHMGVRKTL